jgi:hypothetical protein
MIPFPFPPGIFNVSQEASSVTVHAVLELTVKVVVPVSALTWRSEGVTESVTVPLWVTVTYRELTPVPDIVIVAVLDEINSFCVKVAVIVSSPLPLAGETVSHEALSSITHDVFELIVNVVLPASDPTFLADGVTTRVFIPFWVTVTCWEVAPSPLMVMVAILTFAEAFAVNEAIKVPLPLPVKGLSVNQSASSSSVHEVVELMVKVVLPASGPTSLFSGVTERVITGFCITVTCCEPTPVPDTVIVATLGADVVLALYVAVSVPLPLPEDGLIVSQSASSAIVHIVFELISKVVVPASDSTSLLGGVTDNKGKPLWVIVTCCDSAPVPDIVMVAVLAIEDVLAV